MVFILLLVVKVQKRPFNKISSCITPHKVSDCFILPALVGINSRISKMIFDNMHVAASQGGIFEEEIAVFLFAVKQYYR